MRKVKLIKKKNNLSDRECGGGGVSFKTNKTSYFVLFCELCKIFLIPYLQVFKKVSYFLTLEIKLLVTCDYGR